MRRIRADQRVGLLLAGVVLLTFVGLGASVALPASDPSLDAQPRELTAQETKGMELYRAEGCWYCHTQYIRRTATDRAINGDPASAPEDLAGRSPAMLGIERVGPDLSAVRANADMIGDHGEAGPLRYLSDAELEALAAFLLSR